MNAKKMCCLLAGVAMLGWWVSCGGKKTETTEETTTTAEQTVPIDPSTVGQVTGTIKFEGQKPKLKPIMMDQDPVCVKKHTGPVYPDDGAVNPNGTLPNVFVYVKEGADKYSFPTPTTPVTLDQDG
ncbi:MAG TPA: hypothetical protein VFD30_17735, partial [Terriglobia bacterium]|nr:hypothetical protein [Terriglobia bacterium]